MTNPTILEQATKQLQLMLNGCQIDQLHVFSTILNIKFNHLDKKTQGLGTTWLSICGDAGLSSEKGIIPTELSADTFFDRRAKLVSELYRLMGHYVTDVKIGDFGQLEVYFGDQVLACFMGEGDQMLEDGVWAVTSDDPIPYKEHEWSVSLDTNGEIVLESPIA